MCYSERSYPAARGIDSKTLPLSLLSVKLSLFNTAAEVLLAVFGLAMTERLSAFLPPF